MSLHDLLLSALAFFSEVIGVLSGFGSSTFFLPFASIFESLQFVMVLTGILHCFSNSTKLVLFRHSLSLKMALQYLVPSVVFCGIGALINPYFPTRTVELALGVFLVVIAVITGLADKKIFFRLPPQLSVPLSALSGFLTGFIGTGGAIRGLALSAMKIPKNNFVALSSAMDFAGDFLRTGIYLKHGYMDWNQWFYIPLLGIAAYFGSTLGKKILNRIQQDQFEKIVSIFVFFSGILMIFKL